MPHDQVAAEHSIKHRNLWVLLIVLSNADHNLRKPAPVITHINNDMQKMMNTRGLRSHVFGKNLGRPYNDVEWVFRMAFDVHRRLAHFNATSIWIWHRRGNPDFKNAALASTPPPEMCTQITVSADGTVKVVSKEYFQNDRALLALWFG